MKVIVDVSSVLYDRLQAAVASHGFSSIGQLASLALENQLLLEADHGNGLSGGAPAISDSGEPTGFDALAIPPGRPIPILDPTSASGQSVEDAGWIWGIVNRVFPIKVAARSLLVGGEIKSGLFEQVAGLSAQRADALAKWIMRRYGETQPLREDSLLTGLPMRDPIRNARQRFADSYFGRLDKSGRAIGALFELGLAGTDSRGRTKFASLTTAGVAFAALKNPVIDDGDLTASLSPEEIETYLREVASRVPREKECFKVILAALVDADKTVDELNLLAERSLPRGLSPAAVQTMKAGALGRLLDLRLVARLKAGRSARFSVTDAGQSFLETIGGSGASSSTRGAK